MENLKSFLESGVLECYVLGNTTPRENELVEQMANQSTEVQEEIDAINAAMESYAMANALEPAVVVKPFLLAIIDYTERLKNGEVPTVPPVLEEGSAIKDFSPWLDREDMKLPPTFKDFHAKIIGYTPQAITAIVWIKDMAPQEVHDNEFEKFLILDGTCNITVENEVHPLLPGDYFAIPLHKKHHVTVTSSIACKVILQRLAA